MTDAELLDWAEEAYQFAMVKLCYKTGRNRRLWLAAFWPFGQYTERAKTENRRFFPMSLASGLYHARKKSGLSPENVAEKLGVSRQTISSIETGQFNPTAKLALLLCIALDKKFEELFYFA